MKDFTTTEAQRKASRKWEENNKERNRYLSARRQARSFIRKYATEEDLKELEDMIGEKRNQLK